MARPMPFAAPVMTAIRPLRSKRSAIIWRRVLEPVRRCGESLIWCNSPRVTEHDPLVRPAQVVVEDRQCLCLIPILQGIEDRLVGADQIVAEILMRHVAAEQNDVDLRS